MGGGGGGGRGKECQIYVASHYVKLNSLKVLIAN